MVAQSVLAVLEFNVLKIKHFKSSIIIIIIYKLEWLKLEVKIKVILTRSHKSLFYNCVICTENTDIT